MRKKSMAYIKKNKLFSQTLTLYFRSQKFVNAYIFSGV